ncbi:MAG TPA: glucose-6-phosphate isomerase, partial [Acidothermaceae bacterium]
MKDASTTVEAGGITVTISGTDLVMAARNATSALVDAGVPKSLMAKDPGLWGPDAAELAATRLGWLDLPNSSRQYIPELRDLHARLATDGIDHVVLAGMGGSSLAPEVIAATAGVRLTVLDTTDAGQVAAAIADRLDRT